jgi:hypothetical protein
LSTYFKDKWDLEAGGRKLRGLSHCVEGSSPNIIRMTKSRRMRWAGHVARIGEDEECI